MSIFSNLQSSQKYRVVITFCLLAFLASEVCLSADSASDASTPALKSLTEAGEIEIEEETEEEIEQIETEEIAE